MIDILLDAPAYIFYGMLILWLVLSFIGGIAGFIGDLFK